jgi:hypothetical protein
LAQAQPASTPVLRSFDRVLLLEEKAETSAGVSVGDLNGDGLPDIVLGKGRHWPRFNRVLLNDGHGGFMASNLGTAPDRKLVYRNDGKGHFTEFGTFGDPKWSTGYVTLADLNGDGYPDIVAANRGDYPDLVDGKPGKGRQIPTPSYVCLNDGKGRFPACEALPTESATSIVAADFDGDGAIDLFVPHRDGGGQSIVLWNDRKGHFPTSTNVGPAKAWIRMGAADDLDGDGTRDLAIIDERLKATFIIFNRGRRQFAEPVPASRPGAAAVLPAIADFDGDGWPDIVAGRSGAPNGIWFNTKPGGRR